MNNSNRMIRSLTYWLLFPVLLLFVNFSCNSDKSEYSKLEKYYRNDTVLHVEIFDSLIAFCKSNRTHLILRKSNFKESAISFHIYFTSGNIYYPVYYDSALNRHDSYPEKTLKYAIPFSVIQKFFRSIYNDISADSTQAFFADKWNVKLQLGTQGDSQFGILLSSDTTISKNCVIRLSPHACVTTGTIP
jgi:alpha-L-arabinofuranosidase